MLTSCLLPTNRRGFYPMDAFFDDFFAPFRPFRTAGAEEKILSPVLDLYTTDTEYTVTAELPGVDPEAVKLEIDGDTLVLSGEKKNLFEDKQTKYTERSYGSFKRSVKLPEDVNADAIAAQFKDGVLSITLPRRVKETPAPRTVAISRA